MEGLVVSFNEGIGKELKGKRVFLTGHTGFKGSWLSLWLRHIGCDVAGYALPPATKPNLFELARVHESLSSNFLDDIRNAASLKSALESFNPDVVIHMAAQPLVRLSYYMPHETWQTNVIGTVNLLEAVRLTPSIKAVLVVTTDKCYENREWAWGYREIDSLGGHDPYSASKACTEIVVQSYRKSFFSMPGSPLLATARAGNVIGGGDWSDDRLLPDVARATATSTPLIIRNPNATRPWQHVLACLHGYLLLTENLIRGTHEAAKEFNFGPVAADNMPVGKLLEKLQNHWPELDWRTDDVAAFAPHEAGFLYLDSTLARSTLGWSPIWSLDTALEKTAAWYRAVSADPTCARSITQQQLEEYLKS